MDEEAMALVGWNYLGQHLRCVAGGFKIMSSEFCSYCIFKNIQYSWAGVQVDDFLCK